MSGIVAQGEQRFDLDGAALETLLVSPAGPVQPQMRSRAERVLTLAQAHCPVESVESASRRGREAGRLRASLHIEPDSPGFLVGSTLIYARRQEFTHRTHRGFLRGALATVAGAHSIRGQE